MSGATATIATILNICPIMRLNDEGRIIAYDKVRGRANAVKETIRVMRNHVQDGVNYSGKCLICHSDDPVDGERARRKSARNSPRPMCICSKSAPSSARTAALARWRCSSWAISARMKIPSKTHDGRAADL